MTDRWSPTARLLRAVLARPRLPLAVLGQRDELWRDGRRVHPGLQVILAAGARTGATGPNPDWDKARAEMRRLVRVSSPVRTNVHVVDRRIDGPAGALPVRVYRPHGDLSERPAIVYLHGGGFAVGDLDTHDPVCRRLADLAGCVVVSVHYRRAPEDPFPAAVDDSVAAYAWVHGNAGDLGVLDGVVGVMGDSAGATLSAAACLEARRLGLAQPVAQCLVYPLADVRMRTPSYQTFADGFGLTRAGIELFRDTYSPDPADWDDPRVSPLAAGDLTGLAPALVVTAGFDPLRDDGRAYADALADAGVPVTYRCYDDMIHGFQAMLVLDAARAASDEISSAMGDLMWAAAADRAAAVS